MPPRPPIANTVRVEVLTQDTYESPVRQAANIFYGQAGSGHVIAPADLLTIANDVLTAWSNRFKAFLTGTAEFYGVVVTAVDGTENQAVSTGSPVSGTAGSAPLTASVSACVSWKIGAAYRGGHPRSYLTFLDASLLASTTSGQVNHLSNTAAINIATAGNNFINDALAFTLADGGPLYVGTVSYVKAKAPRVTPVFYGYYNPGTRCNTRLASQRRRLGKLSTGIYEL